MRTPLACAICLVEGRPEMLKRAVQAFCNQTYQNKRMLLFDTSPEFPDTTINEEDVWGMWSPPAGRSIGELRNDAIDTTSADIICHFDSDDWSSPRRIEEQVALLESSGAEAVGYHEAIFWDETLVGHIEHAARFEIRGGEAVEIAAPVMDIGEAYLYYNPRPNYAIGASLAYWRSTWQRRPFPHLPIPGNRQSAGEDAEWLKGVKCVAVSSIGADVPLPGLPVNDLDPSLICSIHGQNSQAYDLALASPYFKRAAWFDDYCCAQMRLEGK